MKKEMINGVITIVGMCVVTILLLLVSSMCAFRWKWQVDEAEQAITGTYILTGLMGGLLEGLLKRRKGGGKIGILKALFLGIILASAYWGIPGGIAMVCFKERILDMGQFAIAWGMVALSITAGLLFCQMGSGKRNIKKKSSN